MGWGSCLPLEYLSIGRFLLFSDGIKNSLHCPHGQYSYVQNTRLSNNFALLDSLVY